MAAWAPGRSTSRNRDARAARGVGRIRAGAHPVIAVNLDQADGAEPTFAKDPIPRARTRCGVPRRCIPTWTTRCRSPPRASPALFDDVDADRLLHPHVELVDRPPRSSAARASDPACRSGRCRDRARAASRGSRRRSGAVSSTPAASRRDRPRRSLIRRSTSQSDTTSTGATWIMRSRSALPHHPDPMRPTRLRVSASCSAHAGIPE